MLVNFILTTKEVYRNFTYNNYDLNETSITYNLTNGDEVELVFFSSSVKVIDCYKLEKKERIETLKFISYYLKENEINFNRTINNLEGELLAHRLAYIAGIKKANTMDADLDYIKDSRWYVNVITMVIQLSGF